MDLAEYQSGAILSNHHVNLSPTVKKPHVFLPPSYKYPGMKEVSSQHPVHPTVPGSLTSNIPPIGHNQTWTQWCGGKHTWSL